MFKKLTFQYMRLKQKLQMTSNHRAPLKDFPTFDSQIRSIVSISKYIPLNPLSKLEDLPYHRDWQVRL